MSVPLVSDPAREERFRRFLQFKSLVRGGDVTPHWLRDGSRFWYAEWTAGGRTVWLVDPTSGEKRPFFDEARLRPALEAALGHGVGNAGVPFADFTLDPSGRRTSFRMEGRELVLDLETYHVSEPDFPSWNPEVERGHSRLVQPAWQEGESDLCEVPSPSADRLVGALLALIHI